MKGLGTSDGIAMGNVFLYIEPEINIVSCKTCFPDKELSRLESALKEAIDEIENLYNVTLENIGKKEADIFYAHKMMLEDLDFVDKIRHKICKERVSAEYAVKEITNIFTMSFKNIEDEYLKARSSDLKDVSSRLLRKLLNMESMDLGSMEEKTIIVAKDLTPSDTINLNKDMVRGIVTELGSKTSHTSIIARTLGVPAISGVKDITNLVQHGDEIIIDGSRGDIILKPSEKKVRLYKEKLKEIEKAKNHMKKMIGKKSISKDGYQVKITGNICKNSDLDKLLENDGEGVGLFRTEFIYMNRDKLPTEDEQFHIYKEAALKLKEKALVIRTLDVGGDKDIPCLEIPKEENPFLGYRAIRICLDKPHILKTQVRAIYRASNFGKLKIIFPMICNISELRDSKSIAKEARRELEKEGYSFDSDLEIGMMVEVPAVAIHSRTFAKEVDFFSIGTNDLIQYTIAVDRTNPQIQHLYDHYHPAVLKLIKMTIDNGHKEGIKVGMCGEMAGVEKLIPVLLAMGLDEFSMNSSSILRSRYLINNTDKMEVEKKLEDLLNLASGEEVEEFINDFILK